MPGTIYKILRTAADTDIIAPLWGTSYTLELTVRKIKYYTLRMEVYVNEDFAVQGNYPISSAPINSSNLNINSEQKIFIPFDITEDNTTLTKDIFGENSSSYVVPCRFIFEYTDIFGVGHSKYINTTKLVDRGEAQLYYLDDIKFAPTLLAPVNGASGIALTNVSFSWTSIPGASVYNLQITKMADFVSFTSLGTYNANTTNTQYVASTLAPNTTYCWRVREKYSDGSFGNFAAYNTFGTGND